MGERRGSGGSSGEPPGCRHARGAVVKAVIQAYTCVGLWMAISTGVILFNKWVLAYSGFPFPISLTLWHMTFCSAVGLVAVRVLGLVKSHNMSAREYCSRVMPIGLLYAGSLWLSNSAYLHLSVSFIQMTKSLMPGLVYAAGCLVGTEVPRGSVAANMGLIAAGVVVCAAGEVALVPLGLLQQLTALGFEALRLTMVQVLMTSRGYAMNPIQSLYYVSPACLVCLLLPFACVEYPKLAAAAAASKLHLDVPVLLANALAAFALNLAVFLLIGKTSALTMNIAGVIKDWGLILASFYLFKAPLTALNLAGYALCCSGVVWYNHAKLRMLKQRAAQQDGKRDEDLEQQQQQPLPRRVTHVSKDDILGEIRRLQHEMDALEQRRGGAAGGGGAAAGALAGSGMTIKAGGSGAVLLVHTGDDSPSSCSSAASSTAPGAFGSGRHDD